MLLGMGTEGQQGYGISLQSYKGPVTVRHLKWNVWTSSPTHTLTQNAQKAFFSILDKALCILDKESRKLELKVLINFNSNKLSDRQK